MKTTYLISFVLLLIIVSSCSSNKKIYNRNKLSNKDEFIFIKQNVVTDSILVIHSSSHNLFYKKLKEKILEDRLQENEPIDTLLLVSSIKFLKDQLISSSLDSTRNYNHFFIRDSLIISYNKFKEKIIGDYTVINKNTSTVYNLAKKDSSFKYNKRKYQYNNKNILVSEYIDSTKIINGIKCFKISFSDKKNINAFDDIELKITDNYELYVTKDITLKYHPYFRYKSILDRYYPIEIIQKNDFTKGAMVKTTLFIKE